MKLTRSNYMVRVERLRTALGKAWEEGDDTRYYLVSHALDRLHRRWDAQRLRYAVSEVTKFKKCT